MRCKSAKFTVVNRRHHCRNCGYVICGDCSKNRFLLLSQSDDPLRVCNTCYKALSGSGSVAESRSIYFLFSLFCLVEHDFKNFIQR